MKKPHADTAHDVIVFVASCRSSYGSQTIRQSRKPLYQRVLPFLITRSQFQIKQSASLSPQGEGDLFLFECRPGCGTESKFTKRPVPVAYRGLRSKLPRTDYYNDCWSILSSCSLTFISQNSPTCRPAGNSVDSRFHAILPLASAIISPGMKSTV